MGKKLYISDMLHESLNIGSLSKRLGKVDIDCDFEEYKKLIVRVCKIAKLLGTKNLRIFSFFNAYEKSEKVKNYLKQMTDIAKKENVFFFHENEKDIYGDKLIRVKELLDGNPDLRCVFDPANFIQVGEDAEKALYALCNRIGYFHIKDVIAATEELVPSGYGDGKIDKIIEISKNKDVVLSIEPHLAVFEGYAKIDSTKMKNKYHFNNNEQSFDASVVALKSLLKNAGYLEENKGYILK